MPKYTNHEILTKLIEDTDWYHINSNGELVLGATSDNALYKASDILTIIRDVSTTDVEPIQHGEWIPIVSYFHGKPDGRYYCSECRRVVDKYENYCPACGVKMNGGNK